MKQRIRQNKREKEGQIGRERGSIEINNCKEISENPGGAPLTFCFYWEKGGIWSYFSSLAVWTFLQYDMNHNGDHSKNPCSQCLALYSRLFDTWSHACRQGKLACSWGLLLIDRLLHYFLLLMRLPDNHTGSIAFGNPPVYGEYLTKIFVVLIYSRISFRNH